MIDGPMMGVHVCQVVAGLLIEQMMHPPIEIENLSGLPSLLRERISISNLCLQFHREKSNIRG